MPAVKSTLKSIVITQSIAILVFVIVPAVVTFLVPRTTVGMRRIDNQPSASITKYVLLALPIRKITIRPVVRVESHVTAAKYGYSTHSDRLRNRKVHTAGDGSIEIIGRDSKYQVQSNPTDAPVQAAQIQAFLDNANAEPFVITSTAGWALTYLLGGVMTGFSALYCFGATIKVGQWLLSLVLPRSTANTPFPVRPA